MPYLDFHLTADELELTKDKLKQAEKPLLAPDLALGQDNRTWNQKRLEALKLLLCNAVKYGHRDRGVFLYSRKKENVAPMFNPSRIGYRSLHFVIEALADARLIEHIRSKPRTLGGDLMRLSEFHVTPQLIRFAKSLGITKETINETKKGHVRLRDKQTGQILPHEWDEYTLHTETLMAGYCAYLNDHNILESTEDYEEKGFKDWGARGEPISLHRNYLNYAQQPWLAKDMEPLEIKMVDPSFCFGGRSGGYWQGSRSPDRTYILIDGKKTKKADYPCSHINLCYRHLTGNWYQTETYQELLEQGKEAEDAYTYPNLHRDIAKAMMLRVFNCKSRQGVSRSFNKWLLQRNADPTKNATDEQVQSYNEAGYINVQILDMIEEKHRPIKDYLYKGVLGGGIIMWHEANVMHHLACYFQQQYNFPVLTVYDEFIVPEDEQPMVKEFMFPTSTACEVCDHYSLMDQIKNL
jgi:hypothetical protein